MSPAGDTATAFTLGELARGQERVEHQLGVLTEAVTTSSAKQAADFVRLGALEQRIKALESWQTWATRLVVGAIITGALGLLYALAQGHL